MVAVRNDVHGPLADEPTCFNKLMAGAGVFTKTLAVAVLPVPPFVEATVTELVFNPIVDPVTLTVTAQEEFAARLTPLKLTVAEPAAAVAVPPQVFVKAGVAATTNPAGSASLKFTPVNAVAVLGLLMDNVSVVELPVKMGLAANALLITGGSITVREAVPMPLAVVLGPVSVDDTLLLTLV
jgi:hypothetical protein